MPNTPGIALVVVALALLILILRALSRRPRRSRRSARPPKHASRLSAGRFGPHATVEVDGRRLSGLRLAYAPSIDGAPDPGEIIWSWVPYQEEDGRGKDRPLLVVASEPNGTVIAVPLTSKDHEAGRGHFVPIGHGGWDAQGRPSWVNVKRVFRVHTAGMRREAATLDEDRYGDVTRELRRRYGWR